MRTETALIQVRNLGKLFPAQRSFWGKPREWKRAVSDVNFSIAPSKTYALVGESGCGKTTTGRCILRLVEPSSGEIFHRGENLLTFNSAQMTARRRQLQMIFQDPYSSLNSRLTAGALVGEGWDIHRLIPASERDDKLAELFAAVGLLPEHLRRYPHEFSGGQRQRLGIARAIALAPEFIVCDEAVSALDVSVQAQIVNLLLDLQTERGIAYLFISHNLAVVRQIAHRVGVMYAGELVEDASPDELFAEPLHPYTQLLLSAIPEIGNKKNRGATNEVNHQLPAAELSAYCAFANRCPHFARANCRADEMREREQNGHRVKCRLFV